MVMHVCKHLHVNEVSFHMLYKCLKCKWQMPHKYALQILKFMEQYSISTDP